jgi:alpha-L-fucosidase
MTKSIDFKEMHGDTAWFVHDRFGMFIHWGLYAMGARHEWLKNIEQLDDNYYSRYFKFFDPDMYDPESWAKAAKNAGMKYFVITTKHHEGFCLWDSKVTDYKATNTPAGIDLLTPMIEAFRKEGLKIGLYHSLIDWHHPDYTVDKMHPQRNSPDKAKLNEGREVKKYTAYLHSQVRELLTNFGKIDIMWFDFSYPGDDGKGHEDWDSDNLMKMIRELQPDVILDDRLDIPYGWDIKTPEQFQPRTGVTVDGKPVVWEACQTLSGSWGYHRDEESWKSVDMLVQMLIDSVSKSGNLLLNVGPTARGELDERALNRLQGIGEWMKRHNKSIYGCTAAPEEFICPQDCRLTYNPDKKRLYVHIFAWPFVHLHLEGMADKVEYAQLLNDGSEIKMEGIADWQAHCDTSDRTKLLTLSLPVKKPNVTVPVIELFLK